MTREGLNLGMRRAHALQGMAMPMKRPAACAAALVMAAALLGGLGGCATNPTQPESALVVVSLEQWIVRGDAARADGLHEAARSAYREGAKAYPADKQPWLRLADSYFQAGDYGNAVLAAQEVIQRDPKDNAGHSLLAVSGLRITAGSLSALREQSSYPVGSREEALDVTRRLREALSDPTLLAPVAVETPAPPPRRTRPAARATPATNAAAATASAAPAATASTLRPAAQATAAPATAQQPAAATAAKPAGNPLDKLK